MPRVLVFDWGGVIQRTVDGGPRRELEAELGLPRGRLDAAVFDSEPWRRASLGRCTAQEAWRAIVEEISYPTHRLHDFVERFFAGDRVDEALVAAIHAWREAGIPVGLLSNAPPPLDPPAGRQAHEWRAGTWGMEGLFDVQVFSYKIHALKPDPRTYAAILQALDAGACEALFVDDSPDNVQGAREVGMNAFQFEPGTWPDEMAQRGFSIPPKLRLAD